MSVKGKAFGVGGRPLDFGEGRGKELLSLSLSLSLFGCRGCPYMDRYDQARPQLCKALLLVELFFFHDIGLSTMIRNADPPFTPDCKIPLVRVHIIHK